MIDRIQQHIEQAQELVTTYLDIEMDSVWNELTEGEHDDELSDSSYIDRLLLTRVARKCACASGKSFTSLASLADLNKLYLQITDYVKDKAERNLENE